MVTQRPKRVWAWESDGSEGWCCRFRFGQLQLGGTIIRHRYSSVSDRWVVKLEVIYDRA